MPRPDHRDDFARILRRESHAYLQIERAACALSTDPVILARVPLIDAELMRRSAGRVDRQCAPDGWTDDGFRGHIEWTDDGPRHT